jgi:arylsulfatase
MTTRREFLGATAALAAAPTTRPNILFLFPDQQRYDWTSLNRSLPLRTPNLNALRSRGVEFTHAAVASPLCAPSRACLASGLDYEDCGVANNKFNYPLEQVTYYKLLRDAGYHVTGCGKLDLHKATEDWGLDGRRLIHEWGFSDAIDNAGKHDAIRSGRVKPKDPYMNMLHGRNLAHVHVEDFENRRGPANYSNTAPTPLPDDAYCDNWIAENGLKLLRAAPNGKPWHLVINFTGPHDPLDITKRMDAACRGRDFPQPHRNTQHAPEKHVAMRQNYSAMVENIDRWVGVFVQELRRRGELDNTLIVYSSDHGEMLGDHDRWAKQVPYDASVRVPLVVAGPGVRARRTDNSLVAVHDLAATFLDYAGVPRPGGWDSQSVRPLLEGRSKSHREYLRSGLNAWRSATDGRYKLVTDFNEPAALYDLHADPNEDRNIAAREPKTVARLRDVIARGGARGSALRSSPDR